MYCDHFIWLLWQRMAYSVQTVYKTLQVVLHKSGCTLCASQLKMWLVVVEACCSHLLSRTPLVFFLFEQCLFIWTVRDGFFSQMFRLWMRCWFRLLNFSAFHFSALTCLINFSCFLTSDFFFTPLGFSLGECVGLLHKTGTGPSLTFMIRRLIMSLGWLWS